MIAYLNKRLKKAALLSVPRDLKVQIPGRGRDKINAAYAYGGEQLTIETVEELIGEKTDFYVKVNLEGFVKTIDTLGGVDIDVPDYEGPMTRGRHHGMHYDDNWGNLHISLEPGPQHLDGKQAMGFVRYRHSKYGGAISDLQRAENQQTLIKALVKQKLNLWNAPRLLKAGSQIMRHVQTDLTWQQTVELFNVFRSINSSEIHSMTVPVSDASSGGIYYSALVESEFHNRLSRMYDFLEGRVRIDCPVTVLNGSGQAGVARLAAERLGEAGFTQVQSDNAEDYDHERTTIAYHGDARMAAERVREALGCGRISSAASDAQDESVTVTLGSDFAGD
jgi:LCP family protein required for cell wall assembly